MAMSFNYQNKKLAQLALFADTIYPTGILSLIFVDNFNFLQDWSHFWVILLYILLLLWTFVSAAAFFLSCCGTPKRIAYLLNLWLLFSISATGILLTATFSGQMWMWFFGILLTRWFSLGFVVLYYQELKEHISHLKDIFEHYMRNMT